MIIKPPKVVFDNRFGQVIFTLKETIKLVFKISPGYLILILVLNTIWGLSALPSFYFDKLILDQIVGHIGNPLWREALNFIIFLLVLRVLIEVARNLLSRITEFLRSTISRIFSSGMDILIAQKIGELDIATLENIEFKNRFNKIEQESGRRSWGLMMPLSNIPNYVAGFIGSLGLLLFLSPWVVVAILVMSLPQFWLDSKFIKRQYALRTKFSPLYRLWDWLEWYLIRNKNMLEFKILGLSFYLGQKLKNVQNEVISQELDLAKSREMAHIFVYLPTSLVEASLYVWFVILTLTQKITVGSLQMYLQALRSAQMNLAGFVSSLLEIYENYLYVVDLIWFFNLKPMISQDGGRLLSKTQEEIRFENVWFRYRDDTPWVLKNINFVIRPGEKLAIVGENGVGKSTLIKLLARFYDPQKGNIWVGKNNLKEINVASWHNYLAILFQKFETYPFTARESIGYGDITRVARMKEIKEVASKTGIDTYIEELPLKYENPLAVDFEKGTDPSVGQWQRIGISRMLFRKKAKILILDEPTSNVDPKAEESIFSNLINHTKGKMLIFISQRFSTVRLADQIMVLERGRIIEQGIHKELMKLGKTYAQLFNLQARGYQ